MEKQNDEVINNPNVVYLNYYQHVQHHKMFQEIQHQITLQHVHHH